MRQNQFSKLNIAPLEPAADCHLDATCSQLPRQKAAGAAARFPNFQDFVIINSQE